LTLAKRVDLKVTVAESATLSDMRCVCVTRTTGDSMSTDAERRADLSATDS